VGFQVSPVSAGVVIVDGFENIGVAEAFSGAGAANVATWTYSRRME